MAGDHAFPVVFSPNGEAAQYFLNFRF